MDLGKVIYDILSGDADVISLVGDNEAADAKRIFPIRADYKEALPLVIYNIEDVEPTNVKDSNSDLDLVLFTVTLYGNTYAQVAELSGYVREALDGFSGTNSGVEVDRIMFDEYTETWDDNAEKPVIIHDYSARILRDGSMPVSGVTPSGRLYFKPLRSFTNTPSLVTGDYAYHRDLGVYQHTIPDYPAYIMKLDDSQATELLRAKTLVPDNELGNKNRFTALDGTQTYGDQFFIDHHTGLGWWMERVGATNHDATITYANSATKKNYSDWRVPTTEEWITLFISQNGVVGDLDQIPVVPTAGTYWCLTPVGGFESTFSEVMITGSGRIFYYANTSNFNYGVLVRNQYTSG